MSHTKMAFLIAAFSISVAAQQSHLLPDTNTSVLPAKSELHTERHLLASPAGDLYYNSAFAHGYRHGYEEGFHAGDLDLQMGRGARKLAKINEYQHDCAGYKNTFGAKELFRQGYKEGFRSGYRDVISGGEFRETEKAEAAAQGLMTLLGSAQRASFDQGFSGGYETAAQQSSSRLLTLDYIEQYCEKTRAAGRSYPGEYCSGFSRGYLLGLTDNEANSSSEMARQLPEH